MRYRVNKYSVSALLGCCLVFSHSAIALNIVINELGGFNPFASAAFARAASQWEARIFDPITVTIDSDFTYLGSSSIIGNASSVQLTYYNHSYSLIRDMMVADAADEPDDLIVSYLPTAGQLQVDIPAGFSVAGMAASKANLKALGVQDLDNQFGAMDGVINFNTEFSFDFDNSDGVNSGSMDFETVAAHEIGHILGFNSVVDQIAFLMDQGATTGEVLMKPLDLFRFQDGSGADPATFSDFTMMPRSLIPGTDSILDDIQNEILMSDGLSQQASHWADNLDLGIMDPTLSYGDISLVSERDLRALDLIGYEITAVPLPVAFWLFGSALLGLVGFQIRGRHT
ncbi:MAG: hypothetical protein H6968_13420 [Chromatiaceae bacterium]|nr:hypothetical protein [Chromatiaceae bacterium]